MHSTYSLYINDENFLLKKKSFYIFKSKLMFKDLLCNFITVINKQLFTNYKTYCQYKFLIIILNVSSI